jgi:hypothetical protein
VTSPELVIAEPTVRLAVFVSEPTTNDPTLTDELAVGNVTAGSKVVPVGSKVKVPAVFTLKAAEVE